MAGKIDTEQNFRIGKTHPGELTRKESARIVLEAIEMLQKVERDYIGRDLVEAEVKHNRPVRIVTAADLHALSIATNNRGILKLRDDVLSDPDTAVILLGDEVEGIKEAYLDTNTARTPVDFHQQIDWLRTEFVEPLANEGRILMMVSGYWGHPGWAADATTINTWRMMTDGYHIPLLRNGGLFRLRFANREKHEMRIWHNPPGNGGVDAVTGLRKEAQKESAEVRADGYASAHIHRLGVAKELYPGEVTTYFISTGTLKGSYSSTPPDRFGVKLGRPLADKLGQGVIVQPAKNRNEDRVFPYPSERHGDMAYKALRILDSVEGQGMKRELLEKVRAKVEDKPKVTFLKDDSVVSKIPYESKGTEPSKNGKQINSPYYNEPLIKPYDELSFDIRSKLPLALQLIANVRLGSSSEGAKPFLAYQKDLIVNNPHALVLYLRNMLDKDASKRPDRKSVLDKFAAYINNAKDKTLAILMDESMRIGGWGSPIGKRDKHGYIDPELDAIPPGSYLSRQTGVHLIHHLSLVKLRVGPKLDFQAKPVYTVVVADKLEKSGSYTKPTFGLRQTYDQKVQRKPGMIVGGHMPNAGYSYWYDGSNQTTEYPMAIATGWFAPMDTIGKGNVRPGAQPGQGVILVPGVNQMDNLAFPTTNADETEYMHEALLLLKGLEILGLTDKVLKRR